MRKLVIAALSFYKRFLSPFVPAACRFRPTCSEYMLEAVEKHGVGRGVCHPFHQGGFDPVR
jgi:uncharacterized protein